MLIDFIWVALVGTVLLLDTTATFQFLLSQPIIACTAVGWLLGDISTGMQVGLFFQLLWLSDLPVGAAIVPAGNFASIVSAALIIKLNSAFPQFPYLILLLVVLYALLLSYVGSKMVKLIRSGNILLFNQTVQKISNGQLNLIARLNLQAIGLHMIVGFGFILSALAIGILVFPVLLSTASTFWNDAARYTSIALFGIGTGLTISVFRPKSNWRWMILGAFAGVIVYYLL